MEHAGHIEKIAFLLLRRRFYIGLFILLPIFFGLFSFGPFVIVLEKLDDMGAGGYATHEEISALYGYVRTWAFLFLFAAFTSGLTVAYALMKPVRRLITEGRQDIEEFGSLGQDFKDMASSFKLYMSTLENISGGIITTDKSGLITMANRQAAGIFDSEKENIVGKNIGDLFYIENELDECLRGLTVSPELRLKNSDMDRLIGCTIAPIRGAMGIDGAVFNFKDITRIREIHRELQKTERLASIGSITMEVAHEVRNPLASIRGFAQLIKEDLKADDKKILYIDTIVKEADRLNRVIDTLYSRKTGEFEGESLKDMLHRAVLLSNEAQKEKSVRVLESYDKESQNFTIKDERLFQGLYNIILNAYEAAPEGSAISISAVNSIDGMYVDVINDSEGGLSERAFDTDISTKGRGRGIGLKIAADSIKSTGGRITVNEEGGQVKFRIWLT